MTNSTVHLHLSPSPDRQLVIIGARPFGRETCNYARDAGFVVKGFLDDKPSALDGFANYPPILGAAESYAPADNDVFVCAVGDSKWREKYATMIAEKGGTFVNVIHPSAYIGPNVKMGVGCIICPQSVVDCDLTLGDHVDINGFAYVPHDCVLEDYATISPGCKLGGGTIVRHGAFLGIGSAVIPHVEIGPHSLVAGGAVVTKDVPPHVMVAGVPAVVKKELE